MIKELIDVKEGNSYVPLFLKKYLFVYILSKAFYTYISGGL